MVRSLLFLFLMVCHQSWVYADCVILLHGLARTSKSMEGLASELLNQHFTVANIEYPSREKPIEALAPQAIKAGIKQCGATNSEKLHFVSHSMGGILIRYYLQTNVIDNLGRVVMLAPPNQGSEVVDNFAKIPGFSFLNGPAGSQLGTDANSIPSTLGPVDYPVGIIAGNKTFNLILSQFLPNPDDGKVSVERTKVAGMADFLVVNVSHPFIMKDKAVIQQTIHFLRTGKFSSQ